MSKKSCAAFIMALSLCMPLGGCGDQGEDTTQATPQSGALQPVTDHPPFTGLEATEALAKSGNANAQKVLDLMPKAEAGDQHAQFELAGSYRDGLGIQPDSQQAFFWFGQAAKQGHSMAQYFMGIMYEYGESVPADKEEAIRWYEASAKQGDASARERLKIINAAADKP